MASVSRSLLAIVTALRRCILLVHHARKANPEVERKQLEDIDELLGSALIGANCDLVVFANKPKEQEKGSLRIHLMCPPNGSRLAEPFERRLWTLHTHTGGAPTITDEEDPEEKDAPQEKADMQAEEIAAELRRRVLTVKPVVEFSVHTLFGESGRKGIRRELVTAAAGLLRQEGLHLELPVGARLPLSGRRNASPRRALEGLLRRALGRAGIAESWDSRLSAKGLWAPQRRAGQRAAPVPKVPDEAWPKPNVRQLRFHDLRHSTATLLLREGVPLAVVQRVLRHKHPKLTASTYGHLEADFSSARSTVFASRGCRSPSPSESRRRLLGVGP